MKYVLINPVVDSMYEQNQLNELLSENDFARAECQIAWGPIVKDKYRELLASQGKPVIDVRCPVAAQKVSEEYLEEGMLIPEIEPILLHCAREISEREALKGFDKVITTPCKALAAQGNALGLCETTFMAWNDFEKTLGKMLEPKKLGASPIPPGFFTDVEGAEHSISGEQEIADYFEADTWRQTRLVELLYCEQGCHNGDGVTYEE